MKKSRILTQMDTDGTRMIFYLLSVPHSCVSPLICGSSQGEGSARELTACKKMAHIADGMDKNRREASQGHEIHFVRATEGSPIPNTHNRGFQWPACR